MKTLFYLKTVEGCPTRIEKRLAVVSVGNNFYIFVKNPKFTF